MRYLVSGKEMKLLDQNTSQNFHVPELVLMEQAAMAFVQKLLLIYSNLKSVCIVCGSGNNGADGLAIARLLREKGISVFVYPAGEKAGHKTSSSYEVQKKICNSYRIPMVETVKDHKDRYDLVIDAIFGTGLSRSITGELANVISDMNGLTGKKVSVDIASGINADDGAVLGCAFRADHTITFSFGKTGQYLWPGTEYSGTVHVVPIGITNESWLGQKPRMAVLEEKDLPELLPKRNAHSNKGTYGKLLIIAGSVNMAGAACLAAKAAYRSGCGLVRVLTAEENRYILQTTVPEAILTTYGSKLEEQQVIDTFKWADAIVAGPGIGTEKNAEKLVKLLLKYSSVPFVLDAAALNIIAKEPELLLRPHTELIVTPHLGEMARLTKDTVSLIQARLVESAVTFAQTYDVICVLKDFHTVTALPFGRSYLNLSGNNGMATAGSGDVLSGIIGSFLAQGLVADTAAPLGVYVHGLAGDMAAEQCGMRSLTASDIITGLKDVLTNE